jgi:hypothetical protein
MKRKLFIIAIFVIGSIFLFSLTGCDEIEGKFTGGGWICPEQSPGPTATAATPENGEIVECKAGEINFGFVFNACSPGDPKGRFNYNDKDAGVKMKGEFIMWVDDDPWTAHINYTSKSKVFSGSGEAEVKVWDLGEGSGDHGQLEINVTSGPFEGYQKSGIVKGNIQEHECDDSGCDYPGCEDPPTDT